jgi:uroporphyrinogen-III decarboxylase
MGIQNVAVRVRGTDFFLDYYAQPELARQLLDLARQLLVSSLDYFLAVGSQGGFFWNQNCTVPLSGPRLYEERLLPYEQELFAAAESRGLGYAIHHCGHFDRYASLYRRVKRLAWIEIGWGSDLRLALDTFPEARVQYIISHQFIKDGPAGAIRDTMRSLVDTAGPDVGRVSFNVADLEYGTPDEHVRAVVEGLLVRG